MPAGAMAPAGIRLSVRDRRVVQLSAEQHVSAFLLGIDLSQRRLSEFTFGLYQGFSFGEESTLAHQILLDSESGLHVTLYHSIRIPDADYKYEASEFGITATVAFSESGCSVEAVIDAHLECDFGDSAPGMYTIHRTQDVGLDLGDALSVLGQRVDQICEMHDAPERVGFTRRS